MNLDRILTELKTERARLDKAIQALEGITPKAGPPAAGRRGRPPKTAETPPKRGRRTLSAAARKRISQAQKRRWAELKKAKAR